jgi:hypothetical protein
MVLNVVSRILDDPSTAPLVYSLYGGPDHPPLSTPIVHSFATRKVPKVYHLADVDIARIEAISSYNAHVLSSPLLPLM